MKYNYNLFNKITIGRKYNKQKNKGIGSPFNRGFSNRINKLNRCSKKRHSTTYKRFNY